jgi:hypothetical protein
MKISPVNTGLGHELICPGCGGSYLHHGEVQVFTRDDEDSETGLFVAVEGLSFTADRDISGTPSMRRDGVLIFFTCENCDATPVMKIRQHKGQTLVEVF